MPLVVVGLNHKSAPIELLERLTIAGDDIPKALHALSGYPHVGEGAILSTCNRIEVYAAVSLFHAGTQDLRNFLSLNGHVPPEDFADHAYAYHDDGAVRHLLRVAGGVDSMVVGESQILGQVRDAFTLARREGAAGRLLSGVFEAALRVGKRARNETGISRHPASISSAAVELARRTLGISSLGGRVAVVVGAGAMARLSVASLRRSGVEDLTIVSRTPERAEELARRTESQALPLGRLADCLAGADIVMTSTSSTMPVIDLPLAESALARRVSLAPLLLIDIAVPRDVESSVAALPGVTLRDLEDVRTVVDTSIGARQEEVREVECIIGEEAANLVRRQRAEEVAPAAAALVSWADSVRKKELQRSLSGPLGALGDAERDALEGLTRRIVAKLLHPPLEAAKSLEGEEPGRADALRALFDLGAPEEDD